VQHRRQLREVEGRELFEVHGVLHEDHLTDQDIKYLKKQVAELAMQTVKGPGQARLVEPLFGVVVPLAGLEEEIERLRQLKGDPRRKQRLEELFALKDAIEPLSESICEKEGGPLKPKYALLRRDAVNVQGAMALQTRRLSASIR